jgi:hypothetical protein
MERQRMQMIHQRDKIERVRARIDDRATRRAEQLAAALSLDD